jgi:N-acetylmuramoyl-L-alanine amidase
LLAGCVSPPERSVTDPTAFSDLTTAVPASPLFPIGGPVEMAPATNPVAPSAPIITPLTRPTEIWIPLQRWARSNGFGGITRLNGTVLPAYALQSTNGVFVFHTSSLLARWDGMDVRLGFAPQLIDGQPYVHTLDLYKTIQPLLQGEVCSTTRPHPVIVIDPGHGGENSGTRSVLGNRYEKEFTLDWALRLQSLLEANNCRTFLTRSNDTDLALSNRVAFAAQHRADLFLSLHFNSAAPNETEAGLETYCLTPVGMPSNLTRGFADEMHQSFPNNAFDTQNLFLALRVHRALLQVNGHRDRGIRRARFPGVLRGQQQPAVLVEGGYLSNPQEARLIEDPAYRQKLAEALVKALVPKTSATTLAAIPGPSSDSQSQHGLAESHEDSSETSTESPPAGIQNKAAQSP